MRIIFIPGLGEDELIFSKVLPMIPGEKLVLNTWELFGNQLRGNFTGLQYAREVAERYNITEHDLLIGHSLGGLTACYIKNLLGCPVIQVASYTNKNRIIVPVSNFRIIEASVRGHLFFNNLIKWLVLTLQYNNKPSKPMVTYLFDKLKNGNKINVINQLKVALNPLQLDGLEPDLRIHSKGDNIVRPPKEPYLATPGDHFAIFTHPEPFASAINDFISSVNK